MKYIMAKLTPDATRSPPARGAWIEIEIPEGLESLAVSPPARGAWIEMA